MNSLNKKVWKIIVLIIVGVLILGGASYGAYYSYYWWPKNNKPVACTQEAKQCPNGSYVGRAGPNCEFAACPEVKASETANWQTYRNEELNFEFSYPREFGEVEFKIRQGEAGKICQGTFTKNTKFTFGGVTKDFTEGRVGNFTDTQGYLLENGKYFYKFIADKKIEIIPSEFIDINSGLEKALLIENQNIGLLIIKTSIGALINLPNKEFPGLGFIYSTTYPNLPTSEEKAVFKTILSTFRFNK